MSTLKRVAFITLAVAVVAGVVGGISTLWSLYYWFSRITGVHIG